MSKICTIEMLRYELRNYVSYGSIKNRNDWDSDWNRTSNGTLSWDWF